MLKQFVKDSAVYGLGKFLTSGVSFLLVPLYTRLFVPADYGVIDLLNIVSRLVMLLVALEIGQAVVRYMLDTQDINERRAYASTALWFSIATYTMFVALSWLLADPLSDAILGQDGLETVFRVAMASNWLIGLFSLAQNQLRYQFKARLYARISVAYTLLNIGFSVLFVAVFGWGVPGFFWGTIAGAAIGLALALYHARESYGLIFDWEKCRAMLGFSAPLVISGLALVVYSYIDRAAIKTLLTLTDVGVFGIGYRVASITTLLMYGFQVSLTPLIYERYREPGTPAELARLFRAFAAAALLFTAGLSLFAREMLVILTTPAYYAAWAVVPPLVAASLLSTMYIFAPGLGIAKQTGTVALINIGGAVVNGVLNFVFIPAFGIAGAGLATLISAALVFAAYLITSQRLYPVPHRWAGLALAALLTTGVVMLGGQMGEPTWAGVLLKLAALGGLALAYLLLGLVDMADVRRIWFRVRRFFSRVMAFVGIRANR